ncbi:MAG: hypothetical protein WBV41_02115 [Terriglobales bacterium]
MFRAWPIIVVTIAAMFLAVALVKNAAAAQPGESSRCNCGNAGG